MSLFFGTLRKPARHPGTALPGQARRYFGERWLGSLFIGTGYVDSGFDFGETDDDIFNYGFGLRYLALPKQDAWVGLDIARGPEDTAWPIQMGSSR